MNVKRTLALLVLVLSVLLVLPLTACQAAPATTVATSTPETSAPVAETSATEAETGFPIELVDATGATVTIDAAPQSIIATTVWSGEMLLDLVDSSRIAALSAWGDDPVLSLAADKAAAVEGRVDISSPESIVALNPDLVILDTFSNPDGSLSKTLSEAGIAVLQMQSPTDFQMIEDAITTLAQATGETARGEEIVSNMNQVLDSVASQVESVPDEDKVTVMFYEAYYDMSGNNANMLAAYGIGSPFDAIAKAAGTVNVCNVANYSPVAKEKVVGEWQPDMLVIPSSTFDENFNAIDDGGAMLKAGIEMDPVLQTLPAVIDGKILAIPDNYRGSTSQYMVQAVVDLAKAAYPDLVQ